MTRDRITSAAALLGLALILLPLVTAASSNPHSFFALYQQNREALVANYITEDFLLLSYSMLRDRTLVETEKEQAKRLEELISDLQASLPDGEEITTVANRDFVSVLSALISGNSAVNMSLRAQEELALVIAAGGMAHSPLWDIEMDYSQYRPRAHYTRSDLLKRYFRAMRYAGGVLFALQPSAATGVSEGMANRYLSQALQLARLLQEPALAAQVDELERRLAWQFGRGEDLTNSDLLTVAEEVGEEDLKALRGALMEHARNLGHQPKILGAPVKVGLLEPGLSAFDVLTGWRLLPSRYSADSHVLQLLVYDSVGEYKGDAETQAPFSLTELDGKQVKGFPLAYELMALLGSDLALRRLKDSGELDYDGYWSAYKRGAAALLDAEGLNAAHLELIRQGLSRSNDTTAWGENERLTAMLAFWTWQRYLSIAYSKQSYTPAGKGLRTPPTRVGAWIDPSVPLYRELLGLVEEHRKATPHTVWDRFAALLERCLEVAERAAAGGMLTAEEQHFLNELDEQLFVLTGRDDHPIVVDVHTNSASGEVLQEGIGFPVVVTHEGASGAQARGARFDHVELKQPLQRRLTDAEWLRYLESKSE